MYAKLTEIDETFREFRMKIEKKTEKDELTALIKQTTKSLIPQGLLLVSDDEEGEPTEAGDRSHARRRTSTLE